MVFRAFLTGVVKSTARLEAITVENSLRMISDVSSLVDFQYYFVRICCEVVLLAKNRRATGSE